MFNSEEIKHARSLKKTIIKLSSKSGEILFNTIYISTASKSDKSSTQVQPKLDKSSTQVQPKLDTSSTQEQPKLDTSSTQVPGDEFYASEIPGNLQGN